MPPPREAPRARNLFPSDTLWRAQGRPQAAKGLSRCRSPQCPPRAVPDRRNVRAPPPTRRPARAILWKRRKYQCPPREEGARAAWETTVRACPKPRECFSREKKIRETIPFDNCTTEPRARERFSATSYRAELRARAL